VIAATIGVFSLCVAGGAPWPSYTSIWWVWWAGDATGVLVITPLLLAWARRGDALPRGTRAFEALALLALVALAALGGFGHGLGSGATFRPLAFLPFPLFIWAVLRFGVRGVTTASLVVAAVSVLGTRDRAGSYPEARAQVVALLSFQAILAGSSLLLAAADGEIRRQAARYKGLVKGLPDVVALLGRDGTVRALHAPRGMLPDSFVGQRIGDVVPADVAVSVEGALEAVLARGEQPVLSFQPNLAGVARDIEVRFAASGRDEVTVVCRDVSEVHRMQAKLLVSERLAAIGMLAAGVAHEINNPLTWVIANLSLARRQHKTNGALDTSNLLADAQTGAERIAGIVRDLLAIARPGGETQRELVEMRDVLELVLRMTAHAVPAHVDVKTDYRDAPLVRGSATRLAQVFLNLVVNALDAMSEATDRPHTLSVRLAGDSSFGARVEIGDTGGGFSKEARARLFEPFFTTKPAGRGTGLGLAICHRIVSSHGGEIAVESEPRSGTVVSVVLPAAEASASQIWPAHRAAG
jgi:signal transduction histidine kinase